MNKENTNKNKKKSKEIDWNLVVMGIMLILLFLAVVIPTKYVTKYSCPVEDVTVVDGPIPVKIIWVNGEYKKTLEKNRDDGFVIWASPYDRITSELENGKTLTEIVPCVGVYKIGSTLCSGHDKELCNYVFGDN